MPIIVKVVLLVWVLLEEVVEVVVRRGVHLHQFVITVNAQSLVGAEDLLCSQVHLYVIADYSGESSFKLLDGLHHLHNVNFITCVSILLLEQLLPLIIYSRCVTGQAGHPAEAPPYRATVPYLLLVSFFLFFEEEHLVLKVLQVQVSVAGAPDETDDDEDNHQGGNEEWNQLHRRLYFSGVLDLLV